MSLLHRTTFLSGIDRSTGCSEPVPHPLLSRVTLDRQHTVQGHLHRLDEPLVIELEGIDADDTVVAVGLAEGAAVVDDLMPGVGEAFAREPRSASALRVRVVDRYHCHIAGIQS